jgi:protein gp37
MITKSSIKYNNDAVPAHYAWNPGGFGCSKGCRYCWAKEFASRGMSQCDKCKAFEVHLHEERLDWPMRRKKPAVILVNFTCDTFDRARSVEDILEILHACAIAPWHNYVFLTKEPQRMHLCGVEWGKVWPENWWMGGTVTDDRSMNEYANGSFWATGKHWISMEPIAGGRIDLHLGLLRHKLKGVIIGQDSRKPRLIPARVERNAAGKIYKGLSMPAHRVGWPGQGDLEAVGFVVEQLERWKIPIYVKQLWIDGELRTDPKYFPRYLRRRDIPWALPT